MKPSVIALAAACLVPMAGARAEPLPDPVVRMLEAALKDAAAADDAGLAAVVKAARATNPNSTAEIDAMVKQWADAQAAAREQTIKTAGFFDLWGGRGQLGGFISTGNSDTRGIAAGINLERDGLQWRHKVDAIVDYQEDDGQATTERYLVGWQTDYKFSARFYVLGLVQWERDTFAGFDNRFSESIGLGYTAIDRDDLKLDFEAGPALRQIEYIDGTDENSLAFRGAANLLWKISPTVTFTQGATMFLESNNSTFTGLSTFNVKLIDALSAQLSFDVRYETDPLFGLDKTDTLTRLTLAYDF